MSDSSVPAGYCQCGCGQWIGFYKHNNAPRGEIKGAPRRYAHGHNNRGAKRPGPKRKPAPKACTKCAEVKQPLEFGTERRAADGLTSACKACLSKHKSEYNRTENYASRYYRAHKEQVLAARKEDYHANKAAYAERWKEYSAENREMLRVAWVNRRAKQAGAEGEITLAEWEQLREEYAFRCAACGVVGVEVDHVIPLSRGGRNAIENIQPLCGPCNQHKQARCFDYRGQHA